MGNFFTYLAVAMCVAGLIVLFVISNKRQNNIIKRIINETADLTAKKVLEVLNTKALNDNNIGETFEEVILTDADGRDIFKVFEECADNTPINLKDSQGNVVTLKYVTALSYDRENGKRETYAALSACDEEIDDKVYFVQAFKEADGSTYLKNVSDYDTLVEIYSDYGKKSGASDEEIAVRTERMKAAFINAGGVVNEKAKNTNTLSVNTKRRHGFKENEKAARLPSAKWFTNKGIKLKEIPIEKKALKSLSTDEKYTIAISTYPTVKRNIFIILGMAAILIAVILIGGLLIRNMEILIVAVIVFVAGSFVIQKLFGVLDGFDILGGTRLVKLPIGVHILYRIAYPVAGLWGAISQMIYMLLDSVRRQKMLALPRVVVPQNCGFDDFIDFYSEYEAECNLADAKRQHDAHQSKDEYENKQKALSKTKKLAEKDENLSSAEKQNIINKANETMKQNKENYEKNVKPDL